MVETNGLTKIYSNSFGRKKVEALTELDLKVEKGIIFGLLGPNGAGKTTLVKILLGISFPTKGEARIFDMPVGDYQLNSKVGYLPENHKYPPYLSGGDVLRFFGRLSGMKGEHLENRIDELLKVVDLVKWKKTKVKAYSKGMMQRLGLAQSLINDPELIFLDEPTDGVDPIGRKEIRDILLALKTKGKTIFLNSHLLSEVELITDRVGILNKGRLIKEGTVRELTERKQEYIISVEGEITESPEGVSFTNVSAGVYSVKVNDTAELNRILDLLRTRGILVKEFHSQKNTLEDMFISLIKEADGGVR